MEKEIKKAGSDRDKSVKFGKSFFHRIPRKL